MEAVEAVAKGTAKESQPPGAPSKPRPVSPRSGAPLPISPGRPKGSKSHLTNIRDAVLEAFHTVGGPAYLVKLANGTQSDRTAFVGLMAKVLPSQIQTDVSGTINVQLSWLGARSVTNRAQFVADPSQTIEMHKDSDGRLRIANPLPGEVTDAVPVQAPADPPARPD
jgi:hypothetical protein